MYQLLLCTRYLRTRYLAFVCIVSVLLGVATLILVNSVMAGFSTTLRDRLHGILSEVVLESARADGFREAPEEIEARIKASPVGKYILGTSPTVDSFALLQFQVRLNTGEVAPYIRHVKLVGVDAERHAIVGNFGNCLARQKKLGGVPSFELTPDAKRRREENRILFGFDAMPQPIEIPHAPLPGAANGELPPRAQFGDDDPGASVRKLMDKLPEPPPVPAPAVPRMTFAEPKGIVIGWNIVHSRYIDPVTGEQTEFPVLKEGDEVLVATVNATGQKPVSGTYALADYFKAEMSEYDSSFVYMDLRDVQAMKGFGNRVNTIQIKLTPDVANDTKFIHSVIVPELQKLIPPGEGEARSWQQHQGSLLAAIDVERGLLNVLLFLIVGVAGFSVLAIFTMIVKEKTRDIGVLKSLGASNKGIARIFVGYGFLLGVVGCALGTAAGLLLTTYINEVEQGLARVTGQEIFDRKIYYFDRIPTSIEATTVGLVNVGAMLIAVAFSVLPAWRAARLHPVQALRFE